MSSQKGNISRTRPQKHQNRVRFKNDLHDKSHQMKLLNSIQVDEVCKRCKDIIEWKIKYRKYKILSQPKTCVKCTQKSIKKSYHVICSKCVEQFQVCAKCLQPVSEIPVTSEKLEMLDQDVELRAPSEKDKRTTLLRNMRNKKQKDDLFDKLEKLSLEVMTESE